MSIPRISFGMIVLNGEPFIRYSLRALYPFAHEIIVVEGASRFAKEIATPDGHSTDSTLETLRNFQRDEDPDRKLQIITKDGFWHEKDEQSQAYAARSTGDYLWQIDGDEFYREEDIRKIVDMLSGDPSISGASVKQITFWGGFDYVADGWYLMSGAGLYNRIFRWGPGYRYHQHRPVVILNADGKDLRDLHWISGEDLAKRGIYLYHYSLVFPKQVREKSKYYDAADWIDRNQAEEWATDVFSRLKKPFRVHNVYTQPSWLERFSGRHPEQIEHLRRDIATGRTSIETRQTEDVERLLGSVSYRVRRFLLKSFWPIRNRCLPVWEKIIFALKNPRRVGIKIRSWIR